LWVEEQADLEVEKEIQIRRGNGERGREVGIEG